MNVPIGSLVNSLQSIALGAQISSTIQTEGSSLCGIYIPANFTGTSISFLACNTLTGTFEPVYSNGALFTVAVAAGQFVAIPPANFQGIMFLQIQANQNQAAAVALNCSMKGI